ncbi:MAG: VacJ family lipoprotein, partial [Rhodospirillales bacterium]|nr:VacJ family lipoprotein [Rhodospirillales bacterium]
MTHKTVLGDKIQMTSSIHRWERLFLSALVSAFFMLSCTGLGMGDARAQGEMDYSLDDDFEDITDGADDDLNDDPLEKFNRASFAFNDYLMKYLLKPIAKVYNYAPEIARDGVHNALANLDSPNNFGNDLLQGEFVRAIQTLERAVINSTVGVGGLMDVASGLGIPKHSADFGQTMAVWGVGEGPYVVLPLLGPSNPRDAFGMGVDSIADPLSLWANNVDLDELNYSRYGATAVDSYARVMDDLESIEETSLDFYATIRSLSRQHRRHQIEYGMYD